MARKKAGTGKAMTNYREEMRKRAKAQEAAIPSSEGSFISIKGGVLTFRGTVLPEPISVIVLAEAAHNSWFEDDYEEGSHDLPDCFAIKRLVERTDIDEMVPGEAAPKKQAEDCFSCWANEWGSAEKGRGKACGNRRRLPVGLSDSL